MTSSVTTTAITKIQAHSARSGGLIAPDAPDREIIACGVCWSTSSSPTIADSHTVDTYVFNVVDYGADPIGVIESSAAVQGAVDACFAAGGGTVYFPESGTYLIDESIKLPAENVRTMTFSGYNTIIKLSNTRPRFFSWNKPMAWDIYTNPLTFKNFFFKGFTVDAQNNHSESGLESVFGFDMYAAGLHKWTHYINIENLTIRDVRVINMLTDPERAWNQSPINVYVGHEAGRLEVDSVWNHIEDVLVQNCRCEGGTAGIRIWGSGNANSSITMDRVYIRECWHDTMVTMTNVGSSSNYQIGQYARVGRAEITNCYGNRSGDVGIEMDQCSEGLVDNCIMNNPNWNAYFYTNFVAPLRPANPYMTFRRSSSISNIAQISNGGQSMFEVVGDQGGPQLTTVNFEDMKYTIENVEGLYRHAVNIPSTVTAGTINILNYEIIDHTYESVGVIIVLNETQDSIVNMTNVTINGVPFLSPWDGPFGYFGEERILYGTWTDGKMCGRFPVREHYGGDVTKLSAFLSTNVLGSNVKAVIYSDHWAEPVDLLATGIEVAIPGGQAVGAWFDLPFAEPVHLAQGFYWLGFICDVATPGLETLHAYRGPTGSGEGNWNDDVYADGPSATWGVMNQRTFAYCITGTYTPS